MSRSSFFLVLPLLSGGCALGPAYIAPQANDVGLPMHFEISGSELVERSAGPWWSNLNDPVLTRLIEEGVARNTDIAQAETRIAEARANLRLMRAAQRPQLAAASDLSRQRLSRNSGQLLNVPNGFDPTVEYSEYSTSFDASWELDFFGRNRLERAGSLARAEGAVFAREEIALRISAEIARQYVVYQTARARLTLQNAIIVSADQVLTLTRQRFDAGETSALDVSQARSALLEARTQLGPLEAEAKSAVYTIDLLLAKPGAASQQLSEEAQSLLDLPPGIATGLPADLLLRRPDVRQAERSLAVAAHDLGLAEIDQYPSISLTGSLGLRSVEIGSITDAASSFWRLGPSIRLPVLDGGQRLARIDQRQARLDGAIEAYRGAVLAAFADVEIALVNYKSAVDRQNFLEENASELARSADLTAQRYEAGETSLLEVIEASQRADRVSDLVIQNRAQAFLAYITLQKALGGSLRESLGDVALTSTVQIP